MFFNQLTDDYSISYSFSLSSALNYIIIAEAQRVATQWKGRNCEAQSAKLVMSCFPYKTSLQRSIGDCDR